MLKTIVQKTYPIGIVNYASQKIQQLTNMDFHIGMYIKTGLSAGNVLTKTEDMKKS